MPNKTVSLVIPVYKGGPLWKECLRSVYEHADCFDEIIISFNKSEIQDQDILAYKEYEQKDHIKILVQDRLLTSVHHICALIEKASSDYIFFLAHDDILNFSVDGKLFPDKFDFSNSAVFGSQIHFFDDSSAQREIVLKELDAYTDGIGVELFVDRDQDKFFDMNMSGIVAPRSALVENLPVFRLFKQGFRLDNMLITSCGIDRIYQNPEPLVRIRQHDNQAGRVKARIDRRLDNVLYYFYQALNTGNPHFIMKRVYFMAETILGSLSPRVLFYFFILMFISRKWSCCAGSRRKILFYLIKYFFTKAPRKIAKRLLKR